jgi:hypothetical protein
MNLRKSIVYVYIFAFALAVLSVLIVPPQVWQYVSDWQKAMVMFQLLLGACGVALAYWVAKDSDQIEELAKAMDGLIEAQMRKNK